MRPHVVALLACLCAAPAPVAGQVRVVTDTLFAPSLGRRAAYQVVLPAGYDPASRYPVLWLLHGYGGTGTNWLTKTHLTEYLQRYRLIVVLPSVGNTYYVNSWIDPKARYEDFIIQDLHADVVRRFAVDTLRESIAGLSMGGYGALMLALRHPARFHLFVGVLSGALSIPTLLGREDTLSVKFALPALDSAFGPVPNVSWTAHDPFLLFRQTSARAMPYFFFMIGTGDQFPTFVPRNRAFTDSLRAYGARYEYHEVPGGHEWQLWDAAIPPLLARLGVEVPAALQRSP